MKDRNCSSLMRCASSLQRLFFLALLSIIAIGAYAQGKTVSGTVLDKSGESVKCSSKRNYQRYHY